MISSKGAAAPLPIAPLHKLSRHNIPVIRQTMASLLTTASLDSSKNLIVTFLGTPHRVSVVYFRATYTPTDFPSLEYWHLRVLLEQSTAIKCPSLPLQLAGGKKVQQMLTQPGVLERFIKVGKDATQEEVEALKATWVDMWALDDPPVPVDGLPSGLQRAYYRHANLVLKPQREGGGNNIYKSHIPAFLDGMPQEERKAWIAMALIKPPEKIESYMIKAGSGAKEGAVKGGVVSELGVFGWVLFGGEEGEVRQGEEGGWLLRTKGKDSDEGGVAVGFSVLDSLVLID
jgi:glutathione synthase